MEHSGDNSNEALEDQRDDFKNELILLHATLKDLNNNLDFTDIIRPLLADTGPAVAHIPKLAKQIARMKKMIDATKNVRQEEEKAQADFLRQSPAQTFGGSAPAPLPNPGQHQQQRRRDAAPLAPSAVNVAPPRRGRGRHLKLPPEDDIVPVEVQPRWGLLARYAVSMDQSTYHNVVAAALTIYDLMIGAAGCPTMVRVKDLAQHSNPQIKSAAS
jgi:hypothetical protein